MSSNSKSGKPTRRTIKVDYLARVEGEGAMDIKIRGQKVEDVKLKIFEPPRFFEALLRGRRCQEAPDITARICGICPVAYQMSACHAIEQILGARVDGQLRELRRLLYCGEWIESHVLHIYMLHAPDFLGYPDAITLAKDYPEVVKNALRLKKAGNDIVTHLGGREIHPINVRIGGFYSVPEKKELQALLPELEAALEIAEQTVQFVAKLPFPDFDQEYEFVALRHPSEYPFNEGRIVSNTGVDIEASQFSEYFEERHVAHSTSLQGFRKGGGSYLVGPMARYSLNFDRLSPRAQELALHNGLGETCYNPFKSILVRSIETLWAVEEAIRIISSYEMPDAPAVPITPCAGIGHGCTEAPRGILYHRYEIDDQGIIKSATIVPPTAQNQKRIEDDLLHFVSENLELSDEALQWKCEQAIRNYDPCISCSCHFLKLNIDRKQDT